MTDIAASLAEPTTTTWFKSSYSGGEGNECVEVSFSGPITAVRDSKARGQGMLSMPSCVFATFVESVKRQAGDTEGR
jgi:hypothetical protein